VPEDATPQRVNAVLQVLRVLQPREGAPFVRRLFDKAPTSDLARLLHDLGDEAGVPFLLAELEKGDDARVRASLTLLELGRAEGFAGIEGRDAPRMLLKRMHFQVGNALDAYLKHARATPEGREKALRFLFEWLEDDAYQPRAFSIIQREIGRDFGYGSARGMDDQDRRRPAVEASVRAAKAWWQGRSTSH
jgi:hypothetical protein